MTPTGATQREELDRERLDDFIQRWEAARNSHDPEQLLELMRRARRGRPGRARLAQRLSRS